MQVLPEVGTLGVGLVNAGVFLVKMVVYTVVYLPGSIFGPLGPSAPFRPGATIMQQCGSEAFSLDDFFLSLQTSTNVFWGSLTMLSGALGRVAPQNAANIYVQDSINGLSRFGFGAGSIYLWTAQFQVLTVMKAGPNSVVDDLPTAILAASEVGWMQSGYKVSSNTLGWAHFGYARMQSCAR